MFFIVIEAINSQAVGNNKNAAEFFSLKGG